MELALLPAARHGGRHIGNRWIRRILLIGSVAVLFSACGADKPLDAEGRRQVWQEHKPANYGFVYFTGGGCVTSRVRIDVQQDVPIAVTVIDEGCGEVTLDNAPTIDGVFTRLLRSYETATEVQVTFDKTYGFPTVVVVNPKAGATDGSSTFGIEEFTPR